MVAGTLTDLVAVLPALFIQAVFIGEAQRCEDQMRFEEAAFDEVQTACEEELGETPVWFPSLIIGVGGGIGALGGLAYGLLGSSRPGRSQAPGRRHLPF